MLNAAARMMGLIVVFVAVGVVGCVPATVPPQLPAGVEHVVDNEADFYYDWDAGSGGLTPGATVDDLAGLTGCWGAVRDPGGELPVKLTTVYEFDATAGAVSWWALQEVPSPLSFLPDVLSYQTGTYEVTEVDGGDALFLTFTELYINDPDTGELAPVEDVDATEQLTLLVTLDGDTLYSWLPDAPEGEEWVMILQRFECLDDAGDAGGD